MNDLLQFKVFSFAILDRFVCFSDLSYLSCLHENNVVIRNRVVVVSTYRCCGINFVTHFTVDRKQTLIFLPYASFIQIQLPSFDHFISFLLHSQMLSNLIGRHILRRTHAHGFSLYIYTISVVCSD